MNIPTRASAKVGRELSEQRKMLEDTIRGSPRDKAGGAWEGSRSWSGKKWGQLSRAYVQSFFHLSIAQSVEEFLMSQSRKYRNSANTFYRYQVRKPEDI